MSLLENFVQKHVEERVQILCWPFGKMTLLCRYCSLFKTWSSLQIRLVIEESLNQLPYTPCTVITPIGSPYEGLRFEKGNCGVSIVRSGEAMEQGLRDCCRSMRIGKILIDSDHDTHEAKVVYAKFPEDISKRKVLLMYPIMSKYFQHLKIFYHI